MNGPGMVQLVHEYAAMEQPATISAGGVKALSAEVKRLQAIEEEHGLLVAQREALGISPVLPPPPMRVNK